jgi:hypothetical protein
MAEAKMSDRRQIIGYTRIPNDLLDWWLTKTDGDELKILLYLYRWSAGFQRASVEIGIRGICSGMKRKDGTNIDHGTGLFLGTASKRIQALNQRGLLSFEAGKHGRRTYRLVLPDRPEISNTPNGDHCSASQNTSGTQDRSGILNGHPQDCSTDPNGERSGSPNKTVRESRTRTKKHSKENGNDVHTANQIARVQRALIDYMNGDGLGIGLPDHEIARQCLDPVIRHGWTIEHLFDTLKAMHKRGQRPTKSWAWFPKVISQYYEGQYRAQQATGAQETGGQQL